MRSSLNRKLPFDMFQRYMLVKEIIDSIRVGEILHVLDVGGHLGVISVFLLNDETFIIDLKVCRKSNFIRADCQFLPLTSKDHIQLVTEGLPHESLSFEHQREFQES